RIVPLMRDFVSAKSVADVGCGEGAWLAAWSENGVEDVQGFDGAYVDTRRLAIDRQRFAPVDLATSFGFTRRFDLVQSLEVAEHLPVQRAASFVRDLCALADVVLFSAAQPGQGGEMHVNEQKVSWWAAHFRNHGYAAFDCLRPVLKQATDVDPWYRFNAVLYANESGMARLSAIASAARCDTLASLDRSGDFAWKMRLLVLRPLPVGMVSCLSRLRYRAVCALRSRERLA
ncbi:MAG TPA: class I SAM-dependent methyltransferase, partial [Beijerinckiaceae bacterium]|nr:class I SAM-dependent methyltransferase [Beijerinckiaceae bacterium]